MYIILDENNFVKAVSWGGILPNGFEVEDFEFEHEEFVNAYQFVDGGFVLDEELLARLQQEERMMAMSSRDVGVDLSVLLMKLESIERRLQAVETKKAVDVS